MRKIAKMQAEYQIALLKQDEELLDLLYPPKYMGIKEASAFLGIPLSTLYKKVDEIPHEKVGKLLVFSDRGLVRWMKRKPASAKQMPIEVSMKKVM